MTETPDRAQAEQAARADARNVGGLIHLSERALQEGNLGEALELARIAADLAPADFRTLRFLSGILSVTGYVPEAIEQGFAALELQPGNAEARLHLGGLLLSEHQWRRAATQLIAYVEMPDPQPVGWRLLSTALQELGRTARALEAIRRAIELVPGQIEYRVHLASLLAHQGHYGSALEELATATILGPPDPRILRARSSIHSALMDYPAALTDAEAALKLDPSDENSHLHLAHVRAAAGLDTHPSSPLDDTQRGVEYWAPRARRGTISPSIAQSPSLVTLVRTQGRIVGALILREMRTRFGRSRLGYVWAILEPISHLLTLGSVFSLLNHSPPPVGDNLFLFYLTGLLPFLMFGHVSQEVMTALVANKSVLQLSIIKRADVIWARALLNLATEIVVGLIVFSAFAVNGIQGMPADLLTVTQSILCLWLIATGIGVLNIVLSELAATWEGIFGAINRLLYFGSGIYYSPISMPETVRNILIWNPVLQSIEWFRSGFYHQYSPHWLDRTYVLEWVVGAMLVGFAAERATRRLVRIVA